ncbi:hypothetical protein TNCV_4785881 [Trichonephila clavipes]|nr:hypothetical protein TNCV_4785881 [Trichonephila clavipes]
MTEPRTIKHQPSAKRIFSTTRTVVVVVAHEIHRGKGLDVRLSLALALSTIQVTVRFSSVKFPKGRYIFTLDGDTTDLHLHNLGVELEGKKIFSSPLHLWFLLRPPTRLSDALI